LAAGTGVEANRATDAASKLAQLKASIATAGATTTVTVTAAVAAQTTFNDIDGGCADNPDTVTGKKYVSFKLLGQQIFTMYCNKDTPHSPLLSLFVADFGACMDACSAYNMYEPALLSSGNVTSSNNTNATCAAVSFIPLWTQKINATAGGAPGNCYLKPGPQNSSALTTANIGTECDAAVLTQS